PERISCSIRHAVRPRLLPRRTRGEGLERAHHRVGCDKDRGTAMLQSESSPMITRDQYDAVLLDLDGVITDTASIHAACWKQMFDEYLQKRATLRGDALRAFDPATDYRLHVDGKPRSDGVRDLLESRGMQLPDGTQEDFP